MAQATGRSRSFLIKDAVDRYLEYEEWFAAQVEQGLDDVRQGRIASPQAVRDAFARFGGGRGQDHRLAPRHARHPGS